ncbi:cell wall-active antibiotics response protein LiaF [Mammaliicoccus sp. Dog046]|uniref:cell wall-active antibiotics response protein LiaF n=1 Tax=Mammaliicoccus sp. Dog046 TaxID=3034233 RepID=UPI002B2618F8|nr:cell wall-active antibiotics response protein LiaF [Mammaliicoccus sp. Dog046]WQK86262.1 cell wall-active antibiotics response protein LiaF [Mammaliicoccus sp. Dog046]
MKNKFISTELLIVLTVLILLSNIYYIFFEKIGLLLVVVMGIIFIYAGYLYFHKLRGLIIFWIGAILLIYALLSNPYMLAILFLSLVFLVVRYLIYRKKPLKVEHVESNSNENINESFIKQRWFSPQKTPHYIYKWEDIQIQQAIGDIELDLSLAANLSESNVIVVRQYIGKTQIIVPYNYHVNVHITALFGRLYMNDEVFRVRNETVNYEANSHKDTFKVNIFFSTFMGDVEVIFR